LFIYTNIPPPVSAGIIMTTTISVATERITLFTLLFNMRKYYTANILPPIQKNKPYPDLSLKGKATSTQTPLFEDVCQFKISLKEALFFANIKKNYFSTFGTFISHRSV
jgi:hypothetical protein